ncbi:unnamed protein product [Chironomus riparius]|uniref:Transmembrane protein n=1 Tax=Chironomus riparius TaxID=315576 RepID=A0A9N9S3D7_9DIPT|nr:unnamed protein product [Chironomus riparius]
MKEKISNYRLKLVNQIFLFSNIWTSLIWVISSYYLLYYQSEKHPNINFTLAGFCIVVSTFIEVVRIYTGYSGNINSDILDLAGFLILSVVIQLPIHIYLSISLFEAFYKIQLITQIAQLFLILIQSILNFIIIRKSLHEKNLQFQMMNNINK